MPDVKPSEQDLFNAIHSLIVNLEPQLRNLLPPVQPFQNRKPAPAGPKKTYCSICHGNGFENVEIMWPKPYVQGAKPKDPDGKDHVHRKKA